MNMKKNIVIVNRRYFIGHGPEKYLFNIKRELEADGNSVIPFAVRRKMNVSSEFSKYFVQPPYGEDVLYFKEANVGLLRKIKILANCVYSFEAKSKLKKLLRDHKVDLVYVLGIVNEISPSIIDACKSLNIPVVMRLSDYNIICGNYYLMRDNALCKLCVTKSPYQCTKHRCVKNQFVPSFARSLSLFVHNLMGIYNYVDAFVCPSSFMKSSMEQAGFPADKLHRINSFLDSQAYTACYENDGYILYVGRISKEKGVDYLLKAQARMEAKIPIHIVGDYSDENYFNALKDYIKDHNIDNIKFIGFKSGDELKELVMKSKFVVAPSIWPDNSPMSVLEAMAMGKPVVGSAMGGIADQIQNNKTGFLVPPCDDRALAEKIEFLWNDDTLVENMGKNARKRFEQEFSAKQHYSKLQAIFDNVIKNKQYGSKA